MLVLKNERLVWKQLCARNKVFNRLEALHRKPSLSIVFNTSSKTKKYICTLTKLTGKNQATWLTYRERWFKWVTAIRITLIVFEFVNLWLDALNEGQVYPWVHRWRLILLVHIYTTHTLFHLSSGKVSQDYHLLRTFVWCLMEKLTRNNGPFLDT